MGFFTSKSSAAVAPLPDSPGEAPSEPAIAVRGSEPAAVEPEPADGEASPTRVPTLGEHPPYEPPTKRRLPERLVRIRREIRRAMLETLEEADRWARHDAERQELLRRRLDVCLGNEKLPADERAALEQALFDDLLGFGAVQALVEDPTVTEIMVNGPDVIFAERDGAMFETAHVFDDEQHLEWTAQRIVRPLQRHLGRANPIVDGRLPDGSRVHVVMPPAALAGTTVTIRKFPSIPLTIRDLLTSGSLTEEVARFLEMCVVARINIVVSGGTGSGKTTLLNVLSAFVPETERIVTIEDAAELHLKQRHVVGLETTPPMDGGDGRAGRLAVRDLVCGALRMRPDRIIVGECRGGEALDMLQAMNTGHDGSLTTVHANGPRDALSRMETLCLMAGVELPLLVIRRQMASAINLIIQQTRMKDGTRKVIQVSEIEGIQGETITMQDLFVYRTPGQTGPGPSLGAGGRLEATGMRPHFLPRLREFGFAIDQSLFNRPEPVRPARADGRPTPSGSR